MPLNYHLLCTIKDALRFCRFASNYDVQYLADCSSRNVFSLFLKYSAIEYQYSSVKYVIEWIPFPYFKHDTIQKIEFLRKWEKLLFNLTGKY